MSTDIWRIIRKEYETTLTSYQKLSNKHGYTKNAIANRSKAEGWIKYKKHRKKIQQSARELFAQQSEIKVLDLIKLEDAALGTQQKVVEGEIPYKEFVQMVENFNGNLTIKMDGTIKGLVEATLLIGDRRRELRGVLPLKDELLLKLKQAELEHKKEQSRLANIREDKKLDLNNPRKEKPKTLAEVMADEDL